MFFGSPGGGNPGAVKVQRNYLGVSLYRGGFHGERRGPRTWNTRLSGGLIVSSATVRACRRCLLEDRRRSIARSSYRSIYEFVARLNRFPLSAAAHHLQTGTIFSRDCPTAVSLTAFVDYSISDLRLSDRVAYRSKLPDRRDKFES